jgi:hypothetical protein
MSAPPGKSLPAKDDSKLHATGGSVLVCPLPRNET